MAENRDYLAPLWHPATLRPVQTIKICAMLLHKAGLPCEEFDFDHPGDLHPQPIRNGLSPSTGWPAHTWEWSHGTWTEILPQFTNCGRLKTQIKQRTGAVYYDIELPLCQVHPTWSWRDYCGQMTLIAFGNMLSQRIGAAQRSDFTYMPVRSLISLHQSWKFCFETLASRQSKDKSGYSTDVEVLEKLRAKHPIVGDGLPDADKAQIHLCRQLAQVIAEDGRIHTTFK